MSEGGWGGHRPPYEYDVIQGELVLNVGRWKIIRKIVRLRGWCDMTYEGIADHLNDREIPGYSARMTVRKRTKNAVQRTDGKWPWRTVANIINQWQSGKRQAWREHYESQRVEREQEEQT